MKPEDLAAESMILTSKRYLLVDQLLRAYCTKEVIQDNSGL